MIDHDRFYAPALDYKPVPPYTVYRSFNPGFTAVDHLNLACAEFYWWYKQATKRSSAWSVTLIDKTGAGLLVASFHPAGIHWGGCLVAVDELTRQSDPCFGLEVEWAVTNTFGDVKWPT